MIPRIAVVGFSLCALVTGLVYTNFGLDTETTLVCLLVPTPLMISFLYFSAYMTKFADSKWTLREHKIVVSDGFYIPSKLYQLWSYSIHESEEHAGYQTVALSHKSGTTKQIQLKVSEEIARLENYFIEKGMIRED
ncbi:hypothetical protein Caka_2890 [Coraliomargarita akajimensis DSM 45221]|uniref:Uncharacterized protein n=2 Tax=Coraliomargarita TaxID=442430 RepID=D5ER59_CORAD|nr:hypothetical protein Caka_2890 [Coraliomargarita akajimensis DSM 45221]